MPFDLIMPEEDRKGVLMLIVDRTTASVAHQVLLQYCAGQLGMFHHCKVLVSRGADVDVGSATDPRTPREIGHSSVDPVMREYFRTVGLLLGRYRLIWGPAGDVRTVVPVALLYYYNHFSSTRQSTDRRPRSSSCLSTWTRTRTTCNCLTRPMRARTVSCSRAS
jgi:hypothetical protein